MENKLTVTDFWQNTIDNFNDENQCGFCWNFFAPLTEVQLNLIRNQDECCVNVFLVRNKGVDFDTQFSTATGVSALELEREIYDVYFLIKSKEGINNYNEMADHPISESREKTIFEPLRKCITHKLINEICKTFLVTQWQGNYIYDYQDEQYYGIKLSITTQRYI